MPDGETFKKLTKAQGEALHRYYKREKDSLLDKTLPPLISTGVPSIVAVGLAAAAYVFKDELQKELKEAGQSVIDSIGTSLFKFTGLGQALSIIGPTSSEYIDGTDIKFTKCQRWENDLVNVAGTALTPIYLAAMKRDGCSKPVFVTKQNWDKV